jgi:UDP-N-acetylmuramoyl-tripeptide--D-alanyl-D-alanine ligase
MSKGIKLIKTYGTKDAEITGKVKTSTHLLNVSITKGAAIENIQTQLVGEYNLPNILAAIAIAKFFNVSDTLIKTALERYIPSNSRSQLIIKDSNKIILDAYNANPTSMKAAIENFAKMEGAKKVLLLGGMMELGVESTAEHQSIINVIDTYKWEAVVLVGGDYNKVKHPYINFDNAVAAKEWFNHQQFENSQILIKGSRSMQMENVIA